MTATDAQVRIVMRERRQGRTQEQAAARANLRSRQTAAKYERLGRLPSEVKQPRAYRTRADPFAADWPEIVGLLERAPELEAKTIFEWLEERAPGRYQEGQLRTLPRLTQVQAHHVQYRHVSDTLLRKPGGFRDDRYRDDLFPVSDGGLPAGLGSARGAVAAVPRRPGLPGLPADPQAGR